VRWTRVVVVVGAAVAACQFRTNPGTGPLEAGIDAPLPLPDAGPCLDISATCANADTLRACNGSGSQPVDTTCNWGCLAIGSAHCGVLVPTGSAVDTADLDATGLKDIDLQGTVNGNDGSISGSLRGMGSGVIAGIDYHLVNGVAVFRVASLHVVAATILRGDHPIAFVSDGDITIDSTIDLQGACTGGVAGPGGHVGAAHGGTAAGNGGGRAGAGSHDMCTGGGGGGDAGSGGSGGNATIASTAGHGGAPFGDDLITVLEGGGGGGGGGGGMGGFGGGGGGALQLVSNGTITVGLNAAINAGGCGGQPGNDCGGGGGAGGAILIEGRIVAVLGILAVNGGGGGGGDSGSHAGSNGQPSRDQASGGAASNGQSGGDGGSGAAAAISDGAPGGIELNGGGGAGAIGRIRINTKSGSADTSGTLSPAPSDLTHASVGSAAVQ